MKNTLAMRFTVFGAVALFGQSTFAQTWQTVHDFVSGSSAQAYDICKDPFGNIYAAAFKENTANLHVVLKNSRLGKILPKKLGQIPCSL